MVVEKMEAARKKVVPTTPSTLAELKKVILEYEPMVNYCRFSADSDDGHCACVFVSNAMVEALHNATELLGDGNFSVSIK